MHQTYSRVLMVSDRCTSAGLTQAIMSVVELPPRESSSTVVRIWFLQCRNSIPSHVWLMDRLAAATHAGRQPVDAGQRLGDLSGGETASQKPYRSCRHAPKPDWRGLAQHKPPQASRWL